MSHYIEYNFKIAPIQPASDILMAELGAVGFESFLENDQGVLAYVQKSDWQEKILETVQVLKNPLFKIAYTSIEIEQENWNATWERNFKPIQVGKKCVVRAPFHKKPKVEFDIVIEPKMSFGTGHHETTHMMLQFILDNDFLGKSVLDMGSGTGVLAILTAMKGAVAVDAIDIDNWCYTNARENVHRNDCQQINVYQGDASLLGKMEYDSILANINRNILMEDIPIYAQNLAKDGTLFVSGFYAADIPFISQKFGECGLKLEKKIQRNDWVALKYVF